MRIIVELLQLGSTDSHAQGMARLDPLLLLEIHVTSTHCKVNLINQIFVGGNGDLIIYFEIEDNSRIQVNLQLFYLINWEGFGNNVSIAFDLCLYLKINKQ